MNTIQHYAALIATVNSMQSRLNALGYEFKEIAPRSALEKAYVFLTEFPVHRHFPGPEILADKAKMGKD